MATKDDIQVWLAIGGFGLAVFGLWYAMQQNQAAPPSQLNTSTATLPTSGGNTIPVPSYNVSPISGGTSIPTAAVNPVNLTIPALSIPDLSNATDIIVGLPYGQSGWMPGSGGGGGMPSPDGGVSNGSCGCSNGSQPSSYYGTSGAQAGALAPVIQQLFSDKQFQRQTADWTNGLESVGVPGFGKSYSPYAPSPGGSIGVAPKATPVGVPGYNGGNSILAA